MPRRRPVPAALLAVLALLAACGAGAEEPPPGATATVAPDGPACLAQDPLDDVLSESTQRRRTPLGRLEPARVVRCVHRVEQVPGRGRWSVRVEERADGDIAALATALRLPDRTAVGTVSCPAVGHALPEVWAVDAGGRAVRVRWPQDVCGGPRPEVDAALKPLTWRPVASRRLQQVQSQDAVDDGCEDRQKNVAGIPGGAGGPVDPAVPALESATSPRACTYLLDEPQTPEGRYVSGGPVPAGTWRELVRALRAAPPARPGCTSTGTRFTVLRTPDAEVFVELDGCRRVLLPGGDLRVATPRVVQALDAG